MILRIFSPKYGVKILRVFLLKTLLVFLKIWSQLWFCRKTPTFCRIAEYCDHNIDPWYPTNCFNLETFDWNKPSYWDRKLIVETFVESGLLLQSLITYKVGAYANGQVVEACTWALIGSAPGESSYNLHIPLLQVCKALEWHLSNELSITQVTAFCTYEASKVVGVHFG
jgi:hypothetical protein